MTPANIDGRSLWPSIRGEADGTHDAIYLSECAWQASRGIVTKDYKFIRTLDAGPFVRPPRELFDLRVDPEETVNIAESSPAIADELAYQLDNWTENMLNGRADPMLTQIEAGLPFRNRIHEILLQYGLTWDEWIKDPRRDRFDEASAARHAGR